ncbi:hypothetical protein BDV95DRAFT_581907 [Massariosphaeria phaeospora]|uniref:Uncharacterized protein n=1 Tax=Massariosphaeria phaeospora TaxID=100035 RepID=A0A7C8I0F0_9PLEO|nr:hypothetical protein BDV95DRAFT_581907 [Massariosphaeria phaeospora]
MFVCMFELRVVLALVAVFFFLAGGFHLVLLERDWFGSVWSLVGALASSFWTPRSVSNLANMSVCSTSGIACIAMRGISIAYDGVVGGRGRGLSEK